MLTAISSGVIGFKVVFISSFSEFLKLKKDTDKTVRGLEHLENFTLEPRFLN